MSGETALPVTVIGGYLGAGKTTLVNHLLRHAGGQRLAVLVNDFGALPIDADLIEGSEADGLIAIAGGCVCCSYGDALVETLQQIRKRAPAPDHIVIETSGVALPGSIAQALTLIAGLALDAVVVVGDAETLRERAADRYLADTIARQLGDADLIVLNKVDLVSAEGLAETLAWIETRWPGRRVVPATRGAFGVDVVLGAGVAASVARPLRLPQHVTAGYVSRSIEVDVPLDAERLGHALTTHVPGLLRAKGILRGADGGSFSLQVVGRRFEVALVDGRRSNGDVRSRIVCIGRTGELVDAAIDAAVAMAKI